MTDLEPYYGNLSVVRTWDPVDLFFAHPDNMAAAAYAIENGLITPEMLPLVANYRNASRDEKIHFWKEGTKRMGIEAHEREINAIVDGKMNMVRIVQDGESYRMELVQKAENYRKGIEERGLTDRVRIVQDERTKRQSMLIDGRKYEIDKIAENTLKLEELKYKRDLAIWNGRNDVTRHVSDNELEARLVQAVAGVNKIKFAKEFELERAKYISDNELKEKSLEYQALLRKAEIEVRGSKDIAYINKEMAMYANLMRLKIAKARNEGLIGAKVQETLWTQIVSLTSALRDSDDYIIGVQETPDGKQYTSRIVRGRHLR